MKLKRTLMLSLGLAMAMVLYVSALAEEGGMKPKTWNFDTDKLEAMSAGWTKEVGEWKVVADETAPSKGQILAQVAKSDKQIYNIALVNDVNVRNVDLSVKMRPLAGEIDQGGGVVWRAKDAKNYYICRYNPLEGNFRVYKVEDGKRTQLGTADIDPPAGWGTLRVTMTGEHIECFYNSQKHLDVQDATFKAAGKIGLWTKADAQTHFDDVTVSGN